MAALQAQAQLDSDSVCEPRNTVIVTGFGPFRDHAVNASWEAVKLLPATGVERELGICLVTEEVPVSYSEVQTRIPLLWNVHKPLLVLHVGVSSQTKNLKLELVAHKTGYKKVDIHGNRPGTDECGVDFCPVSSTLDIEQLSKHINTTSKAVQADSSTDAGRYVCEYIYLTSLKIDCSRTLFIHVPPLDKPYSAEQLAEGLADILRCLVPQLRDSSTS